MEIAIVLGVTAGVIILFINDRVRVDVVALGGLITLLVTGVLTTGEALSGFSSTSLMSIAFLFVVGEAVFRSGLADTIANRIFLFAGQEERRLLLVLCASVAFLSAFISSTGVVALMLPAVISLAGRLRISPSRLLIPMAFSSLFGGTFTIMGTPPNLIVSEALGKAGYAPFTFFSFTPIGLSLGIVGIILLVTVLYRFLPDRSKETSIQNAPTPTELFELYNLKNALFRVQVQPDSSASNQTIEKLNIRREYTVNIVSVTHPHPTNRRGRTAQPLYNPRPDCVLLHDDILVLQGEKNAVETVCNKWGFTILQDDKIESTDFITTNAGIAEMLLRPRSTFVDKTLTELEFRQYNVTVLGLRRAGNDEFISTRDVRLKFGDMLLVYGRWHDIFALKQRRRDLVVMGEPEAEKFGAFQRRSYAPMTLFIMMAMVASTALNIFPLVTASMVAVLALILTRCVTMDEAYNAIDMKSIILIACMIPFGVALEKVGIAESIAVWGTTTLGQFGPLAVMAGLFVFTSIFTQVLSNTVTAVLVAPIAIASAQQLGIDPHAFLMTVGIAATMAFASPVATPVNMLVMSAGNYRFTDYTRVGVILIGMSFIMTMIIIPILFPF
ncbi:MAG TPA: SLC13 family permease [Aggregatilineales bacterium]|nr:SLC13 family permease [Aggregatilineales bacterium]